MDAETTAALKGHVFYDADWPPFAELRREGKPIILNANSPIPQNLPVKLPRISEAVLLPLHAKGEVMGAMLIGQREDAELLTDRKIELISGIANQAALAIESAQLFAAQQEEAWVTTALLQVAESVNSTLGLQPTLETVVRLTPMLAGVSRCAILRWELHPRAFLGGAAWGLTEENEREFLELALPADPDRFLSHLATSPEPITCGDEAPLPIPDAFQRLFDVPTLLGLPLIAQGKLVGAMLVDHAGAIGNQRHMNILTGIAQQTAMALETSRLQAEATERQRLERELEVARGIQESFLPDKLPSFAGWELAACYRAARQVGGDFYDVFPLKINKKWGLVIADVADKGVPAALFMALSRTLIRAAAYSRDDPAETLSRVNEMLLSDSRSDLFVTVWYGVWDPATGDIAYASAGHNPPILFRANGFAEELRGKGIVLGVINTVNLERRSVHLSSGDVLVAYTDGLTEAFRTDGTEFGVVGLQSAAVSARQGSATAIMERIEHAVDAFTAGEPPFDDMTMIVLKRGEIAPGV
jgi:serine phosphatase RsbU (regulator of sigma subunit)